MNTVMNKLIASASFVLLLGLVSCQESSLVIPDQPLAATEQATNTTIPVAPKYTLTRQGQAVLAYDDQGRLKTVTYPASKRDGITKRREYTYNDGSIGVITYEGTKVVLKDSYLLDSNGRCYQSSEVNFVLDYGNSSRTWIYTYNDKGQLRSCVDNFTIGPGSNRTEYVYNTDGDLTKASTYATVVGGKLGENHDFNGLLESEITISYNQPAGEVLLTDKYAQNASWATIPDAHMWALGQSVTEPYLPIFGIMSKHLPRRVTKKQMPNYQIVSDKVYAYTLNTDGYVTERRDTNPFSDSSTLSEPYTYLVTNLLGQF